MNTRCLIGMIAVVTLATAANAQVPWDTYEDVLSNSVCDVVNAGNSELVVLSDTGEFVLITGADVILDDTFVDLDGFVYYQGEQRGLIDFADDGDGFRTLWWLTLTGNVVEVDGFSGEPVETDFFPQDFTSVPCDACPLWDDPTVCEEPIPTVHLCGVDVPLAMGLSLMGLCGMRFVGRRAA